jgi:hypothetical protein
MVIQRRPYFKTLLDKVGKVVLQDLKKNEEGVGRSASPQIVFWVESFSEGMIEDKILKTMEFRLDFKFISST